jgi:hypothetical protein
MIDKQGIRLRWELVGSKLDERLAKYEQPDRPVPPAAPLYPDGHTTISHVKNPVMLPTMDELRRLSCVSSCSGCSAWQR